MKWIKGYYNMYRACCIYHKYDNSETFRFHKYSHCYYKGDSREQYSWTYDCKTCKDLIKQKELEQKTQREQRGLLYTKEIKKIDKHQNEKCSSCDKPINFEEWFCYCSLCPDCFLNSDEEIDNYLGEKKKEDDDE